MVVSVFRYLLWFSRHRVQRIAKNTLSLNKGEIMPQWYWLGEVLDSTPIATNTVIFFQLGRGASSDLKIGGSKYSFRYPPTPPGSVCGLPIYLYQYTVMVMVTSTGIFSGIRTVSITFFMINPFFI